MCYENFCFEDNLSYGRFLNAYITGSFDLYLHYDILVILDISYRIYVIGFSYTIYLEKVYKSLLLGKMKATCMEAKHLMVQDHQVIW